MLVLWLLFALFSFGGAVWLRRILALQERNELDALKRIWEDGWR